ncbi:hypothetical protein OUZ56_014631 [Daphnia magna]|uniref:Uncharacterized protein n=1 Tax=Daphnia magna TaxID=35525 RepID=A0ABR0AKJ6_9CRUS|nr:hypothetical protein OUZ56_014631 [Daphnia magna]
MASRQLEHAGRHRFEFPPYCHFEFRRQKSWANVLENKNKLRDLGTENQFPPMMLHCVAEKEPSHHSLSINRYLFFRDSLGREKLTPNERKRAVCPALNKVEKH